MTQKRLLEICPPNFRLKTFVKSPNLKNTFFIVNSFNKLYGSSIVTDEEPSATSAYVTIYDFYDVEENVVGHLITHKAMQKIEIGEFFIKLERFKIDMLSSIETLTWQGDFMTLVEGDNGCLLFNTSIESSAINERIGAL